MTDKTPDAVTQTSGPIVAAGNGAPLTASKKIVPTVGRIVYVKSVHWDGVRPALITNVYEDEEVEVGVSWRISDPAPLPGLVDMLRKVPILQPGEEIKAVEQGLLVWAEWMPYQVGQAPSSGELLRRIGSLEDQLVQAHSRLDAMRATMGDFNLMLNSMGPRVVDLEKAASDPASLGAAAAIAQRLDGVEEAMGTLRTGHTDLATAVDEVLQNQSMRVLGSANQQSSTPVGRLKHIEDHLKRIDPNFQPAG